MTTIKFIFLSIVFYSCGQNNVKQKADPSVTILSNKVIPLTNYLDNLDSCKKALLYLDSATTIDSNCFSCYYNKLIFLSSLNQYEKAVLTINNCIRIKPYAHDLYLKGGIFLEKISDTVSSKKYFQKSLTICNSVLDTMNINNADYEMLMINKAVNLIMLGDQKKGNEIFKKMYDQETEPDLKKLTLKFMNKNKKQLLDSMIIDQ